MADSKKSTAVGKAAAAAPSVTLQEGIDDAKLVAATTNSKVVREGEIVDLVNVLLDEINKRTVTYDGSVTRTIKAVIDRIDEVMSEQLAAIMHHEKFRKLEGSWRGLHYLAANTPSAHDLKIKVRNISKERLAREFEKAPEIQQSKLYRMIFEAEFDQPGGHPYGALIGDYEFTNEPDDIGLLENMAKVGEAAFCPFVSAAAPELLGLERFQDLRRVNDLANVFQAPSYAKWRSLRDSESSRFLVLTMPRTLARLPYGKETRRIDEFGFEEMPVDGEGKLIGGGHEDRYCWMNSAFVYGARLTEAFYDTGWCTRIRGEENGGLVEGLPVHDFIDHAGDEVMQCPTEVPLSLTREKELSALGFLPLLHTKNKDEAVFYGGQTVQKPKKLDDKDATANAAISARIPYILAASRIAHYLKCIAVHKIGSFMERETCEKWLNNWIMQYVINDADPAPEIKARFPLAEARIHVEEVPGSPGEYKAALLLRPWLMLEQLTAAVSMVTTFRRKEK